MRFPLLLTTVGLSLLTPLEVLMAETPEPALQPTQETSEQRSTLEDQTALAVTIYNDDLALVRDSRRLSLPAGRSTLAFRDVSARIQPETALLRTLEGTPLQVVEQNFDFDLLTPAALLEKYVGREVGLIKTHPTTGEETEETATVLAATNGVVLRVGDRIETFQSGQVPGRIIYRDIPPNLRDRPTLVLMLEGGGSSGEHLVELSYLSGGLSWRADYVGELSPGHDRLDLTGWVTLSNQSGTSYQNAALQLVAGDVNRVKDSIRAPQADAMMLRAAAPAPDMREERLFEYHLYSLGRKTTIADNQTKQVTLLEAPDVSVSKALLIRGDQRAYREPRGELWQELDVRAYLTATNDEASNLGIPLPAGIVRIYQRDSQGNAQFIGEDRIDHRPKNEQIRLQLGQSFDVTARQRQTDFKKLSGTGPWQYQFESAYEVLIKNAKPEAERVRLQETIPGDWTILEESAPHEKGNARTAVWNLEVPAEGEVRLSYRVRVRF